MAEILQTKIKKLQKQGLKENVDYRIVHFGNWFEIKFIKKG